MALFSGFTILTTFLHRRQNASPGFIAFFLRRDFCLPIQSDRTCPLIHRWPRESLETGRPFLIHARNIKEETPNSSLISTARYCIGSNPGALTITEWDNPGTKAIVYLQGPLKSQ